MKACASPAVDRQGFCDAFSRASGFRWREPIPMLLEPQPPPDVYSGREIARAAGVSARAVAALIRAGALPAIDGWFVAEPDAVQAVRRLRQGLPAGDPAARPLFSRPHTERRAAGLPLFASGLLHASGFALLVFLSALGASTNLAKPLSDHVTPVRLVYLNLPGPGGGGGGARQLQPPPAAKRRGPARVSSPVPIRRPTRVARVARHVDPPRSVAPPRPDPKPEPAQPPPPLLRYEALPPVVAPIVSFNGDAQERLGVLTGATAEGDSRGPGDGSGTGGGAGTGMGEGSGPGIGPGEGGGTGGGPYRPGSGIEPPRLVREVKPRYTEAARQRGLEGEVVVEIVVRRDGAVGDIRVVQSLGAGLDERAVEAVRQWRFAPARRLGTPVDVLVEVAVEFRVR